MDDCHLYQWFSNFFLLITKSFQADSYSEAWNVKQSVELLSFQKAVPKRRTLKSGLSNFTRLSLRFLGYKVAPKSDKVLRDVWQLGVAREHISLRYCVLLHSWLVFLLYLGCIYIIALGTAVKSRERNGEACSGRSR